MGFGRGPDGRNFTQLPAGAHGSAKAVAAWLEYNAPCMVGAVPWEWTRALLEHLQRNLVSQQVISSALQDLGKRGFRFEGVMQNSPQSIAPPQTSMGPGPSAGDRRRGMQLQAEHLERKFRTAEQNGDVESMQKAAQDYLDLLGQIVNPGRPMPGRGAMARQREQFLQAAELLRSNAPALTVLVRNRGFETVTVQHLYERVQANRARRMQRRNK